VIAGRHAKILICCRIVDHLELAKDSIHEIGRNVSRADIINEEGSQPFISKAYDHWSIQYGWDSVPLYGSKKQGIVVAVV